LFFFATVIVFGGFLTDVRQIRSRTDYMSAFLLLDVVSLLDYNMTASSNVSSC